MVDDAATSISGILILNVHAASTYGKKSVSRTGQFVVEEDPGAHVLTPLTNSRAYVGCKYMRGRSGFAGDNRQPDKQIDDNIVVPDDAQSSAASPHCSRFGSHGPLIGWVLADSRTILTAKNRPCRGMCQNFLAAARPRSPALPWP